MKVDAFYTHTLKQIFNFTLTGFALCVIQDASSTKSEIEPASNQSQYQPRFHSKARSQGLRLLYNEFCLFCALHSSNDSRIRVENNTLHFTKVSLYEDGVYQCVAENSHGMIVSSTWVHILSKCLVFQKNLF